MIVVRSIPAWLVASLAALALCGCAGGRFRGGEREGRNVYPANFKTDIMGALRPYLIDPTNIRDAYVSEPALRTIGAQRQNRYTACLRFNAKNSDGRYQGSRDMVAVFVAGRFDQFVDPKTQPAQPNQPSLSNPPDLAAQVNELCKDADFKRFPELESLPR